MILFIVRQLFIPEYFIFAYSFLVFFAAEVPLCECLVAASAPPNYCILNCAAQTATGSLLVFMQARLNDLVLLGCTL